MVLSFHCPGLSKKMLIFHSGSQPTSLLLALHSESLGICLCPPVALHGLLGSRTVGLAHLISGNCKAIVPISANLLLMVTPPSECGPTDTLSTNQEPRSRAEVYPWEFSEPWLFCHPFSYFLQIASLLSSSLPPSHTQQHTQRKRTEKLFTFFLEEVKLSVHRLQFLAFLCFQKVPGRPYYDPRPF